MKKMNFAWLIMFALAVAGLLDECQRSGHGRFRLSAKEPQSVYAVGYAARRGSGPQDPQGPAGPAGPSGDRTLPLKADNPAGHANYASDTRWCGIGDCDEAGTSIFEIGIPVQAGAISRCW